MKSTTGIEKTGDFLGYLGLEDLGIITNHDKDYLETVRKMATTL
jgi:hypothetical protein